MNFTNPDYLFKAILIGNSAVGKSSILKAISEHEYDRIYTPTLGIDFKVQTFTIDDKLVKLQIWDTAGQERFRSVCRSYYKGSQGVIFVYDVADRMSFKDIENWMEDVEKIAGHDVCKILVGNKSDLTTMRRVPYEEGKRLANNLGIQFMETSAKMAYNVEDVFINIAKEMKAKAEAKRELEKAAIEENARMFGLGKTKPKRKMVPGCCKTN